MLSFVYPAWLFGLLLLPLLGLIHWQQTQREHQAIEAFAREPLWDKMGLRPVAESRLWRGFLVLTAIACLLLALAQPRWGASGSDGDAYQQGSLVVMLDLSKSMWATDANGDSRLHAAQRTMDELLPQLAGWKIGVVAFAGQAQAMVPLTTDHAAVDTLLARAQPGQAPGKGSNLEAGLKASLELFTQSGRKVLLVLSDGEELSGNGRAVIPQLRQKGVQVLALGVGSTTGSAVPGATDMWGNPSPITYRGSPVVSKLQEDTLKALASDTGGQYFHPESAYTVKQIAGRLGGGAPTARPLSREGQPRQGFELFQLPLALGLFLILVEAVWGLMGRPRAEERFTDHLRAQLGRRAAAASASPWWRRLAGALRRPAAYVLLLSIAWSQTAWTLMPSWVPNWQAGKAYAQKDYDRAGIRMKEALEADPENWRLRNNMGMVRYQNGNFYGAIAEFQHAWDLAPPADRPGIGYNLGNSHFRQGEATGDQKEYERAIEEYGRVLEAKPKDADAAYNLALAKKRLEALKKKPPQSGGQSGGKPQNGGQGSGQTPIGAQTQHKPLPEMKNLPSNAEVDALLKALESDERQRQAEAGAEPPQDPNAGTNLLQQALGTLDLDKDW